LNFTWIKFLPKFIRRRIEGRETLQKAMANTGWMISDQILRMAVGLVVGVWIARYLGPELFGMFSYAIAFAMLFSPVAVLGLQGISVRHFIETPSSRNEIIGTTFLLIIVGGLAVFALAMWGIFIVRPDDTLMHWLVGITIAGAIFQAFSAIEYWFESQYQWKYVFLAKNPVFLIISLAKVGLIVMHAPLIAFVWAGLAEMVLGAAGLTITYRAAGFHLKDWGFKTTTAVNLLKDSWPLMLAMIMNVIYMRIDQIMLGDMAGSVELGFYSVAVRLSEVWMFIAVSVCASVYPAVVEAGTISEELFYDQLQKLYRIIALVSYTIAIPVMFASNWLIKVLYGAAYFKAGPLLAVLIWSVLFTNLGEARSVFLLSKNWTRIYLGCMVVGGLVNIGLNYLLIPMYGAMGAVIATCFSYWLAVHGICFIFKPLRKTGWMMTKAIIYPKVW